MTCAASAQRECRCLPFGNFHPEMIARAEVSITETDARRTCNAAGHDLVSQGQLTEAPQPGDVLDALCAHHVLERFDYPATEFRFQHQQFQEFYAAVWLDRELAVAFESASHQAANFVQKKYVNVLSWDEPLRMIVEKIGSESNEATTAPTNIERCTTLIETVLEVDPIFAADLARLAGDVIWRKISESLTQRIRAWYRVDNANHKHCALAAMFATGSDQFGDVILPLLTSDDQQVRLATYRAWPEFHLSSLGTNWRTAVGAWKEVARSEFVSEFTVIQRRTDVAEYFSLQDPSTEVRIEAIKVLSWIGADEKA